MQAGCDTGLRETGVKIFPCHLFPLACYFLPPHAPCPQLSGPLSRFFPTPLTGKAASRKGRGRRARASDSSTPSDSSKAERCLTHLTSTWETNRTEGPPGFVTGRLGLRQPGVPSARRQHPPTARHQNGNAPGMQGAAGGSFHANETSQICQLGLVMARLYSSLC